MDDTQLRTLWLQRQYKDRISPLSHPLTVLMKYQLGKRVRQLSKLAAIWDEIVPDGIRNHTALESFRDGVLTALVDSASHRYQLQVLLTGGLTREIRSRFSGTLKKIRLIPGQFYSIDLETGALRYQF